MITIIRFIYTVQKPPKESRNCILMCKRMCAVAYFLIQFDQVYGSLAMQHTGARKHKETRSLQMNYLVVNSLNCLPKTMELYPNSILGGKSSNKNAELQKQSHQMYPIIKANAKLHIK